MDDRLEYEMDEQDMEFVSKTLQQQFKLVLNEDKFEQIIDRLEKESAKLVREFFSVIACSKYRLCCFVKTGENVRSNSSRSV